MDFTLNEEQQAVADLANRILGDRLDMERHMAIEASDEWFDRDTYAELAKAGLVGIAVAEDVGGGGLGLVELGQVLEAQGRHVAPMPLLPTALAALAIDAHGTDEQRRAWLPGVADGSVVLTVGLQEYLNDDIERPDTVATASGDGYTLTGTKVVVEFARQAERAVVSARTDAGPGLFLVDLGSDAVTLTDAVSTRLEPLHEVTLDGARAEALGSPGDDALHHLYQRAIALLCSTQVGVLDAALRMTADYTSTREQFGRPVATFQAVTQRLADAFIHVEGARLTTYASVWELDHGRDAAEHLHMAKWYCSKLANEVAHATQHVHGGMGVSVDYPLHRYTLWNKHIETSLGAGTHHLRALGALLAAG